MIFSVLSKLAQMMHSWRIHTFSTVESRCAALGCGIIDIQLTVNAIPIGHTALTWKNPAAWHAANLRRICADSSTDYGESALICTNPDPHRNPRVPQGALQDQFTAVSVHPRA